MVSLWSDEGPSGSGRCCEKRVGEMGTGKGAPAGGGEGETSMALREDMRPACFVTDRYLFVGECFMNSRHFHR